MSTATSTDGSPSHSPIHGNNAPKFGTLVPNRIFVGGILANTTESELFEFFATYGNVMETKIIADRAGVSKGYGFVTFETEEEARRIQKEDSITMKDHKLNIAPAIRKQPFSRTYSSPDSCSSGERPGSARQSRNAAADWNIVSSPTVADAVQAPGSAIYYHPGTSYAYPNNLVYAAPDGTCQYSQQAYYPVMYSPPMYLPQPYYQSSPVNATQWAGQPPRWATHLGYSQSSNPNSNLNSSILSSASQYVYGNSGSVGSPATPTSGSSQANTTSSSTNSVTTPLSSPSVSDAALPTISTPISITSPVYSYPPPPIHGSYQPLGGAGDLVDGTMMEAAIADQPGQSQGSWGLANVAITTKSTMAGPFSVQSRPSTADGETDEYSLPPFDQGYGNSASGGNGRGYHHQHRRGGPPPGSPRKSFYGMQYGRQNLPRFSSTQHYRQPKQRQVGPIHFLMPASGMGDMSLPPHLTSIPMTPPIMPVETHPEGNGNLSVMDAANRLNTLVL